MSIKNSLEKLKREYGLQVEFDDEKKIFYEIVDGKRKKVKFTASIKVLEDSSMIPCMPLNKEYEKKLLPGEKYLRNIIIKQIDDEVEGELMKEELYKENTMGRCHSFWPRKQELLKKRYNIYWASPKDEEPLIIFD